MPPKKKKAGGKKKKSADAGVGDPGVIAKSLELQNEALQRQLAERTERAIAAERVANDLRSKMRQLELDMAGSERSTFDITAEMTRQYKAMQENLMARVTGLEDASHRLQDDLAASKALLEETRHEKNAIIARRDEEIERLKVKLEDMAAEFGDMLAETLRKMGERVELAASSWEGEAAAGVPIIRRMEEFSATGTVGGSSGIKA